MGGAGNAHGVSIAAEPRSNSLIVRTSGGTRLAAVRDLVTRLDQPTAGSGNIHVVYLKNADAVKLAQQHPQYLAKQLQEFKSGQRGNAPDVLGG